MGQYLYCNPDPATQARATLLGCGWVPGVPPQFASQASVPCVILAGAGLVAVVPDSPPTTPAAVAAAAAPIVAAETAAAAAQATQNANAQTLLTKAANALANNATYLAIGSPTTAQAIAQVNALTLQIDALIRLAANQLSSTSGT
jgi:hypothetical protein